jgi:hypothetical protein
MTKLPPKNPPSTLNRLQQLITELEKQSGLPVRRLNMRVASMMLAGALSRLLDGEGNPTFVTKGGIAMELRMSDRARATQDVDVVLRAGPDTLEEAAAQPYEGFTFRAGEPQPLPLRPHISRVAIPVLFGDKPFNSLMVEVSPVQAGGDEYEMVPGHDLSDIGLKGPDVVPVLALRWQIAQKLHAVTEQPQRDGGENPRFWDLIDLQLLEVLATDTSLAEIREACERVFSSRGQQPWPPQITVYPSWADAYDAMARELSMPITDVDEAAAAVTTFIERIAASEADTEWHEGHGDPIP